MSLDSFQRYPLLFGPSPVHRLERLTAHLGGASVWAKREDVIKANKLIQDYIKKDKNHHYIDVWPVMLKNGRPDGAIFVSDSLHMNEEGYKRWTKVFRPILEKSV